MSAIVDPNFMPEKTLASQSKNKYQDESSTEICIPTIGVKFSQGVRFLNPDWVMKLTSRRKMSICDIVKHWFKSKRSIIQRIRELEDNLKYSMDRRRKEIAETREELFIHKKAVKEPQTMEITGYYGTGPQDTHDPQEQARMEKARQEAKDKGFKHLHTKADGIEVWVKDPTLPVKEDPKPAVA